MYLHASREGQSCSPRDRVLAAALSRFANRGYAATTTRAIATEAGVNEVTLFRHFGSKSGLLAALRKELRLNDHPYGIDPATSDVRGALLEAAAAEVERTARFGPVALRLAMEAQSTPEVAEALGADGGPGANLSQLTDLFTGWQRRGLMRSDVPAALLAEGFAALTSSLLITRHSLGLPHGDAPADVAALVGVFCDGAGVQA